MGIVISDQAKEFLDDYFFTILTMKPEMISRNRARRMLQANAPDY